MSESKCVFCQILTGTAATIVKADGISSIAIEPLNPVAPGHLLVIPRKHVADALEDPATTATTMHDAAQWAKMIGLRDDRYNSVNIITSVGEPATQSVFHLHVHIVPRTANDGLHLPWTGQAA